MDVVLLNQREVDELLPMKECIEVMERALGTLARGDAVQPVRPVMRLPEETGGLIAVMPGYLGDLGAAGVKVISVFPRNLGTRFDAHQGAILLFETEHGRLLALIDATSVTAIRTAAVSAVATRALSREDAGDLAILGSGTQARSHLDAMLHVRDLRRVRVWSRTPEHAAAFAERESARLGIEVEAVWSAEDAVRGADLICTTTSSPQPILRGAWLDPGSHVNAVGSSIGTARELDGEAVARARLFVDRRESAMREAGDFLIAREEGVIGDDHILGELGEVVIGRVRGRASAGDITLFESLGLAVEDVAAAHHLYRKALALRRGTWVEFGGARDAER